MPLYSLLQLANAAVTHIGYTAVTLVLKLCHARLMPRHARC